MKKEIYIVTAYRWGDRSAHSYPIGVFSKKHAAIKCADDHTKYRGGKYACFVESCVMDEFDNDTINYTKDVYKTESVTIRV